MDSIDEFDTSFTDSGKGYEAYLVKAEAEKERLRKEEEERIRQEEEQKRQEEEREKEEQRKREEESRKREEEKKRELHEKYDSEPYGPGKSKLWLSAEKDRAACFRLVKMNGDTAFVVFLEEGESTMKEFLSGRYTLMVARGKEWISNEEAFGSSGDYSESDVYTFESGKAYEITTSFIGNFSNIGSSDFLG